MSQEFRRGCDSWCFWLRDSWSCSQIDNARVISKTPHPQVWWVPWLETLKQRGLKEQWRFPEHLSAYQCGLITRLLQHSSRTTRFYVVAQGMSRPSYCKAPSGFMLCPNIRHWYNVNGSARSLPPWFQWKGERMCRNGDKQTQRGMCHFHWQGELDHMAISNGEKAWSCAQMKLLTKKGVDFNGQVIALEVITQLISPFNLIP